MAKFKLILLLEDKNFNTIEITQYVVVDDYNSVISTMSAEALKLSENYKDYRVGGLVFRETEKF